MHAGRVVASINESGQHIKVAHALDEEGFLGSALSRELVKEVAAGGVGIGLAIFVHTIMLPIKHGIEIRIYVLVPRATVW